MRKILLGALLVASVSTASAGVIATAQAAGTQFTTVANTTTVTFDSLPTTTLPSTWAGGLTAIGTYSTGAAIVGSDTFGGANKTNYISVGAQSGTTSYTLALPGLQSYFGMYWLAIDPQNKLEFLNGAAVVGTFTHNNFDGLGDAYNGNPNYTPKLDQSEHFVYVNFTVDAGTKFDSIRFSNNGTGTGFESDNHAILSGVPEPSTYGLMLAGLGVIGALARRRRVR
jgi:hypothetical protein